MKRDITVTSKPLKDCQVLNAFTLSSTHTYDDATRDGIRAVFDRLGILDPAERDRLISIQGAAENRQFIRVLVPKGSKILTTSETNVSMDDSDPTYTIFKFYSKTDVGKMSQVRFEYSTKPADCTSKPVFYRQP